VASPLPRRIFEVRPVRWLLEQGCVVVCTGGGGIPTMYAPGTRRLVGAQAVIDKDRSSAVLARDIDADLLVIVTDAPGVCVDWGTPRQRLIRQAHPDELDRLAFPSGSMGPKVEAACAFARQTGHRAAIGALAQVAEVLAGTAGTVVYTEVGGISYA